MKRLGRKGHGWVLEPIVKALVYHGERQKYGFDGLREIVTYDDFAGPAQACICIGLRLNLVGLGQGRDNEEGRMIER